MRTIVCADPRRRRLATCSFGSTTSASGMPVARRCCTSESVGRIRRDGGPRRPKRRRQDHDSQAGQPAAPADVRHGGRRRTRHEEWDGIRLRRRIGYVFQDVGLFPHMTIEENVSVVPRLEQWPADRARARAHELLELVGLPAGDLCGALARRIVRWTASAGRPGAGARRRSADPVDGRAVRRARSGHAREVRREFARIQQQLQTTVDHRDARHGRSVRARPTGRCHRRGPSS